MKYKVGDKVRVRNDLVNGKLYGTQSFYMDDWEGEIVTISKINFHNNCYTIEEDKERWYWTDEMFEDVSDDKMDNSKEFHDAFVKMIDFAKEHLTKEQFNEFVYAVYAYGIENVYITETPVYENIEYNGWVLRKRIKSVEYKVEYNHESKKRVIIGNKGIG